MEKFNANLKNWLDSLGRLDRNKATKLICDAEDLEIPNSDGLSMLVAREYMAEIRALLDGNNVCWKNLAGEVYHTEVL